MRYLLLLIRVEEYKFVTVISLKLSKKNEWHIIDIYGLEKV